MDKSFIDEFAREINHKEDVDIISINKPLYVLLILP